MKRVLVSASTALGFLLAGCSANTNIVPAPSSVLCTECSDYSINVFAQAPGDLNPDDIVELNGNIWVVMQDPNISPTGQAPSGAQSLVYEYNLQGVVMQMLNVPGHPDGEVAYDTNTLWVSSNEDGSPIITVINASTGALQSYTSDVAVLPHGGGLDDLKVMNGVVYAAASNPTTTFTPSPNLAPYSTDTLGTTAEYGVNTGPALYTVSLNSDGVTFHSTPVLMSSTPATLLNGDMPVTLNMTDADSTGFDPAGDFVEDSQQDAETVFVQNIGTAQQQVNVLLMTLYGNPWPIDDTRWSPATGKSFMLVSDPPTHLIYRINATNGFAPSTAYSAGQGTVLVDNMTTGNMTPIYVGMNNPHGLIFVPTN